MSETKVVKVDFFTEGTLPARLRAEAKRQKIELGSGLIVVKTKIGSPPSYDFKSVGTKPKDIQGFMQELAVQDGVDLGKAVQKAFSEE